MFGLALVVGFGALAITQRQTINEVVADLPSKISIRLDKLWQIAQQALSDKRYLRAEKALLMILHDDERNATAYNRLGIIYAKQQQFKDAIECFEIAQSLEPSASSLHNVGLIYYETKQYDKAGLAFEQALSMENTVPSRYIAYAKVQEKLDRPKKMIEALEKALELEKNPQTMTILADAYARNDETERANELRDKASQLLSRKNNAKRQIKQPRRVIM